ncbi:putative extracellular serine carboxypeptidase [Metarhizium anisopliae]|nr:putative extracellular serine carboxypeptidase [Metarhizium anisopliae]
MKIRNFYIALGLGASQVAALYPGGPRLPGSVRTVPVPDEDEEPEAAQISSNIKAYNMSVPIDHFHNETKYQPHSNGSFNLRYWADVSHYKQGGPVIILHSGEFSSEGRLPFLDHGIASILTQATGGVGIVLEHRYYGTSWPTDNATTENYRFLTTDQALADTAFFSKNLKIPGHEQLNLTAPETPHILYGGSYAGGFVAIARKLYPDVFWGAISSSGVTVAIDDYWQYHESTRNFAPGECSPTIQKLTAIIDHALLKGPPRDQLEIKEIFGLRDLFDDEFASYLSDQLPSLQGTNWDPDLDDLGFGTFCAIITSDSLLFKSTEYLLERVRYHVEAAGHAHDSSKPLTMRMLNYIGYIKDNVKRDTRRCRGKSLRECLSVRYEKSTTEINENTWQRSWLYQTCTEWGYFMGGASTPKDRLPMISRALTAKFASYRCESFFNIKSRPNVGIINKHGGFNFSYPRVALIDGKQDPWRSAGVHAIGLPSRQSTPSEPFELIDWGVHHWDENGLDVKSLGPDRWSVRPKAIQDIQRDEVEIVKQWLREFEKPHHARSGLEL